MTKERKGRPLFLVVLSVLIFGALIFYWLDKNNDEVNTAAVLKVENDDEFIKIVSSYILFVENDSNIMDISHGYTNEALLKLIEATKAVADKNGHTIKADIDSAKMYADRITHNPLETTHANDIRKATVILGTILQNIQQAKYPSLAREANDMQNASRAIDPNTLTLQQRNSVKNFFKKAAILLKQMK